MVTNSLATSRSICLRCSSYARILVQDQCNGDILYLDLILVQQKQNEIQRPLEVLQCLPCFGLYHFFQFENRMIQC